MKSAPPSPALLWVWRIRTAFVCTIPSAISFYFFTDNNFLRDTITIGWMVIFVLMFFILLPIAHSRYKYGYDYMKFVMEYGMIYYRTKSVDIANIKFIQITRSPLERVFGLCTIKFVAPGSFVRIEGLDKTAAKTLEELFIKGGSAL